MQPMSLPGHSAFTMALCRNVGVSVIRGINTERLNAGYVCVPR
jgi:hypothetical protein